MFLAFIFSSLHRFVAVESRISISLLFGRKFSLAVFLLFIFSSWMEISYHTKSFSFSVRVRFDAMKRDANSSGIRKALFD